MAYEFQVVIDARNPRPGRLVGRDPGHRDGIATDGDTARHQAGSCGRPRRLCARLSIPRTSTPVGSLFQHVPEAKSVKNRLHLDVRVGADREMVVERLVDRGATFLHTGREGPQQWVTLADPEGNEFCVG